MEQFFTTHQAARVLGIHPFTVGRHIDRGFLKAFRTAGGHRRVAVSDLRGYLVEHGMPLPPDLAREGGKARVLVLDDEPRSLSAIRRAFKPFDDDIELTMTTSRIEALLLLGDQRPEAMLLDLPMPGVDGFEFCRRVTSFESLAGVKVVAMTSLYRSEVIGSALSAGAVACLEKPIDAQAVLALISRRRRTRSTAFATACAIIGCGQPVLARGYCSRHYGRRRKLDKAGRLPADWVDNARSSSVRA